ncbi:MAG: cytochrome b [Bacteroidia bacterium]
METGLLHGHSGLRYIVFLLLLAVIVKAIINLSGKKEWAAGDTKITLFLMATTHLQLLIGFVLYFVKGYQGFFSNMGDNMKVGDFRWAAMEHPLLMVIVVVLISLLHIGNKKPNTKNKSRRALILGIASLVLALAAIPFDRWF